MNTKSNVFVTLLFGICLVVSCTKEEVKDNTSNTDESAIDEAAEAYEEELNYTSDGLPTRTITYFGQSVEVVEQDGEFILGGDMIVEPDDPDLAAKGVARTSRKWPRKTVPYVISSDIPNKARIRNAIQHVSSKTGIRFVARKNQGDYVQFRRVDKGCSATVGRKGGRQFVSISDKCSQGSVIHEIGHALGVLHEMARTDRGNHVNILWNNIRSGKSHNFQTFKQRNYKDGRNYGSFDFGSIMMYSSTAFRKNKNVVTITRKNGSTFKAQRNGLSNGDVNTIKSLYR